MKSKTIILSAEQKSGRGILTIYEEDDLLKCKLRLYNIPSLNRYCKLGIYHNNEVFSANLLEKSGMYLSSFVGDFDIDKDFYTAIVDTSNNNEVILSGGTYAGFYFNNQEDVFNRIEKENPNTSLIEYEDIDNITGITQNECIAQEKNNVNKVCASKEQTNEEKEIQCDMCANCKYKEYFYSTQENTIQEEQVEDLKVASINEQVNIEQDNKIYNQQDLSNKEFEKTEKQEDTSILSAIVPQFKYVFENYQADEALNNLIPNGKFVKIDENNEQYSIGAIYEEDEMKYICYAVLKDYNTPAPVELGKHYQWLPLDKEDPLSEGYYIVFQDAKDLKIVEL